MRNFEIITEIGREWGDAPQIFSDWDTFVAYIAQAQCNTPDCKWYEDFPEPKTVNIEDVIGWLSSMNKYGRDYQMRVASITPEEKQLIICKLVAASAADSPALVLRP